jgi:hypothetical protein
MKRNRKNQSLRTADLLGLHAFPLRNKSSTSPVGQRKAGPKQPHKRADYRTNISQRTIHLRICEPKIFPKVSLQSDWNLGDSRQRRTRHESSEREIQAWRRTELVPETRQRLAEWCTLSCGDLSLDTAFKSKNTVVIPLRRGQICQTDVSHVGAKLPSSAFQTLLDQVAGLTSPDMTP